MEKEKELLKGIKLVKLLEFNILKCKPGILYLESVLTTKNIYSEIEIYAISIIGYYYGSRFEYEKAYEWLSKISKQNSEWKLFLDLLTPQLPKTIEDEQNTVKELEDRLDSLLNFKGLKETTINLTMFNQTFWYSYYLYNPKNVLKKYVDLQLDLFPSISKQTFDHIQKYPKKDSRIRLGILSPSLVPNIDINHNDIHCSSISDSFYPTFKQFSKEKFEIIYIYVGRTAQFMFDNNNLFIPELKPTCECIREAQTKIVELNLDILLFLDFHMKPLINFLPLSKLAPIQMCTHGHPITTGLPKDLMNYFISWEDAEIKDAHKHYTEELVLISKNMIWEYFIPRNNSDFVSLLTNKPWGHYTKNTIDFLPSNVRPELNWDFCPQATFKFHITFDIILKNILIKDPNSIIVLVSYNEALYSLNDRHINRLKYLDIDLSRIVFINKLPHDKLMAMYNNCNVILDSYFFGGDTTTREAFEVGAPIITLPSHILGGRWTQAYYKNIGVTDLIAYNETDYVDLAIKVATNKEYYTTIKNKIYKNKHKLFRRKEAITNWENMFINIKSI
jgi:predicted O-linked N-acetylglucosamine transferase (SPINDLY family)